MAASETAQLKAFYEGEGLEDLRLQKDSVQYTEFLTLTKYLSKVIPPNSRILDPCAGTGVYSFYLADQGHQVVAGDLFEINTTALAIKAEKRLQENPTAKPLEAIYQGDVRELENFPATSFDCVLCMGALYHLQSQQEQARAVEQCLRVLKPGGILVATYINRLGALACNFADDVKDIDELMEFLETGIEGVFYAHTPTQIEEIMGGFPLQVLYHLGVDGIGYLLNGITQTITYQGLLRWRQFHFATCENREILGYSYHGAYIAQKSK